MITKSRRHDSAVTWRIISVLFVEILALEIFTYSSSSVLQMSRPTSMTVYIYCIISYIYKYLANNVVAQRHDVKMSDRRENLKYRNRPTSDAT